MNILVVNPILFTVERRTGGWRGIATIKDTMIHDMCAGFRSLGHSVTLAAAAEYAPAAAESYDFDVKFFRSDLTSVALPSRIPYSRSFVRYLREHHSEFDLVVASEIFQFYTLAAARICPEKTVVWQEMTSHQSLFHKIPSKLWHHLVVPLLMRRILGVIPRSPRAAAFIGKYTSRVSAECVDHGIDAAKFAPSSSKKRQIIASARLVPSKGIDHIITEFAKLHAMDGYADIRLIIAGDGEERAALESLANSLGIAPFVEFTGFLPRRELGRLVAQSLLFAAHSTKDLNMVSISEALCAGTPVLTNMTPAIAPFVNENGVGIACNGWTASHLREVIDRSADMSARCLEVRPRLTCAHAARRIIALAAILHP